MARKKPSTVNNEHTSPCVVEMVEDVDAIITGDIHLREDQPVCRTDDFFTAQAQKIEWLRQIQQSFNCPIIDAGDVFSKSRPSPYLLRWAIENMPHAFHSIPGNHDLPEHSIDNIERSGFGVLVAAKKIIDISGPKRLLSNLPDYVGSTFGVHWNGARPDKYYDTVIMHVMTYNGDRPWPGCTDPCAQELLDSIDARLIITGHNHVSFVVGDKNKLLVNPGSLMRTTAAQADFKPRVYLYNYKRNQVQPLYVPIRQGVVSREHIDVVKAKEERLSVFVSRLAEHVEVGLNYHANMEQYFSENRVRRSVRRIIETAMEIK